jgi:tyrosyl-tRNA synthetase
VDELAREVETRPDQRIAQKRLAHEFTSLIHGESEARAAAEKTQRLYTGGADVADLAALAIHVEAPLGEEGTDIVPLLLAAKLLPSKGQAKRMVDQGGVYVNEERITSDNRRITAERLKDGYLQVRVGKKKRGILAFPVE